MSETKEKTTRVFAFDQEFPNEIETALHAYDSVFKELTSVASNKISFSDEYGVVNNLYKFRYITPGDIATFTSNLIKVVKNQMIHTQITDLEKFAVLSVKQFMEDHKCVPIENSSIYGLYNYTTDNMTLGDLLVLCENDFYHTTVVSKFEMHERVKVIQKDYKVLKDMTFSKTVMNIVSSLPKLITQTEFNNLSYIEQKAIQTYIQNFILFAIMMNTVIMSNMILFCVPKSTYNTKLMSDKPKKPETNDLFDVSDIEDGEEDGDVVQETVDTSAYKPVYIVLMSGEGFISKQVKKNTGSAISHVGITFDPSMARIYSFGTFNKHVTEDAPNKNGFRIDSFFTDNHKDVTMSVYAGYVSNENFDKMKKFVEDNYVGNKDTHYSLGTIWKQLWKSDKLRKHDDEKKLDLVCSTFVDKVLKEAGVDVTKKNLPSPHDFDRSMANDMVHFERVFNGLPEKYNKEDMLDRLENFARYKKTAAADEAVEISSNNKENDVVSESVKLDDNSVEPVYVVLTEGTAMISNMIKSKTRCRWSHAGLSFDTSMHKIYSFGTDNPPNEDTKSKDGFRMDDMHNDHHKGMLFNVYVAFISKDKVAKMKKFADEVKNSPKTKYSASMIIHQALGIDSKRHNEDEKKHKQVCSTFVNSILKAADIDITGKNRPSPGDIERGMMIRGEQFDRVFSGTPEQFDEDEIIRLTKQFADGGKTQKLAKGDVVTECCLLKTGLMRCTSKIPFDINMRNIVLQDMHPKFKDTRSAIDYITMDTRSPIAQMLLRYGSPSEVLNGLDGGMICKMFMNDGCYMCHGYDEYHRKLDEVDFHTDVNWLDRIAYGNNFVDNNYRTDAVGNEHRHPIRQTLDVLYRMFDPTKLKTKEELSQHIIKVSYIMKSIIDVYAGMGIRNWEMVRDILAVLGEIMTRSMIKLYSNHMTIVASDNMNDVDAPGYMYTD